MPVPFLLLTDRAQAVAPATASVLPGPFALLTRPALTDVPSDLVHAVAAGLLADAGLSALFGREGWIWIDEAPAGEPVPVATVSDVDRSTLAEPLQDRGRRTVYLAGELQIQGFAATRAEARRLARAAAKAAELLAASQSLACEECTVQDLRRNGSEISLLDPDKGTDGGDVWGHTVTLDYLVCEDY